MSRALLRSPAARDGFLVIGAQGFAALIALGVDAYLFRTLPKAQQGALSAGLAFGAMLLQASDFGAALTTIRLGAKLLAEGRDSSAARLFGHMLLFRLFACTALILPIYILSHWNSFLNVSDAPALTRWALPGVLGGALTWWGVDVAQARRGFASYAFQQVASATLKAGAVLVLFAVVLSPKASEISLGASWTVDSVGILATLSIAALTGGAFSLWLEGLRTIRLKIESSEEISRTSDSIFEFGKFACTISVLAALTTYADIYLVQHFLGEEDTAVFACARRLAMALNLLATACITVLLPRAAALATREECAVYLRKALKAGALLAVVTAGSLALVAEIFVPIFGGPNYRASIPVLRWLCVAQGLSIAMTPMMLVFYPLHRERALIGLNALGLLVLAGLGAWLTPIYKLDGAAWAVIAGKFAVALSALFVLYREFSVKRVNI